MTPAGLQDHELAEAGFLPGVPGVVMGPFDRRDRVLEEAGDRDDIWEDSGGIRTRYQPQTLLLSEPRLWRPFTEWTLGLHEMTPALADSRSAFEVDALLTLIGARHRKDFPKKDD